MTRSKLGVLTWEHLSSQFPEYLTRVKDRPNSVDIITFGELAQTYLNGYRGGSNTRSSYKHSLNRYWNPKLANRTIISISKYEIRKLINDLTNVNSKTKSVAIVPLRGVFNLALLDGIIKSNPVLGYKPDKTSATKPDPLSVKDANIVIAYFYEHCKDPNVKYLAAGQYYEFAFYTGMRPSEILALTWADIDFNKKTAFVCKAITKKQLVNSTKTGVDRIVHLTDRALNALEKMQPKGSECEDSVFTNPKSKLSVSINQPARSQAFNSALLRLGIRSRSSYVTRHTFATLCLMAGVNPAFLAAQLGHSIPMLLKTYARWIDSDDSKREIAKIGKILGN